MKKSGFDPEEWPEFKLHFAPKPKKPFYRNKSPAKDERRSSYSPLKAGEADLREVSKSLKNLPLDHPYANQSLIRALDNELPRAHGNHEVIAESGSVGPLRSHGFNQLPVSQAVSLNYINPANSSSVAAQEAAVYDDAFWNEAVALYDEFEEAGILPGIPRKKKSQVSNNSSAVNPIVIEESKEELHQNIPRRKYDLHLEPEPEDELEPEPEDEPEDEPEPEPEPEPERFELNDTVMEETVDSVVVPIELRTPVKPKIKVPFLSSAKLRENREALIKAGRLPASSLSPPMKDSEFALRMLSQRQSGKAGADPRLQNELERRRDNMFN